MDLRSFFVKKKKKREEAEEPGAKRARAEEGLAARIHVNRSPVMILWAASCLERRGLAPGEALSVASAAASAIAGAKAASLDLGGWGQAEGEERVGVLGVAVSARRLDGELRGLDKEGKTIDPSRVSGLLESKFEAQLSPLRAEMRRVAAAFEADDLAADDGRLVYDLYASFRPAVAAGRAGWGAKGSFDVAKLSSLAPPVDETPADSEARPELLLPKVERP